MPPGGTPLHSQRQGLSPPIGHKLTGGVIPEYREVTPVDVTTLKQPKELTESLRKLQDGTLEQRLQALKEKVVQDLVFVKGGTFWMGDFGPWHGPEILPYTPDPDNGPFQAELDSYSISRYKVTRVEFNLFAEVTGQPKAPDEIETPCDLVPDYPVGVSWPRAKAYAEWLAKLTGLPFDLPTEAQWEYAARSGGQYLVYATDNGHLEMGRNVPTYEQHISWFQRCAPKKILAFYDGWVEPYPIAMFPPNPLGLCDLAHNGLEWTQDWYSPYPEPEGGVVKNPQGPPMGTEKVVRGHPNSDSLAGLTIARRKEEPVRFFSVGPLKGQEASYKQNSFRLVVKAQKPIPREGRK